MVCEGTIIKLVEYDSQIVEMEKKIKDKTEEMEKLIEKVRKRGLEVIELDRKIKRLKNV